LSLADEANEHLKRLGYKNAHMKTWRATVRSGT